MKKKTLTNEHIKNYRENGFIFPIDVFSLYEINIGSQLLTRVLSQSKRIASCEDLTVDLIKLFLIP